MHTCDLKNCDGTKLGHELARDFPEETARIVDSFDRMADKARHPERYVDPANLQVDEPNDKFRGDVEM